jgi:hypothetical protein
MLSCAVYSFFFRKPLHTFQDVYLDMHWNNNLNTEKKKITTHETKYNEFQQINFKCHSWTNQLPNQQLSNLKCDFIKPTFDS